MRNIAANFCLFLNGKTKETYELFRKEFTFTYTFYYDTAAR